MMTACLLCGQDTLMGMHPKCIQRFIDDVKPLTEQPTPATDGVCLFCPFRKGPTWMLRCQVVMNRIRVRKGLIQHCHRTTFPRGRTPRICLGNVQCLSGGNEEVLSPVELEQLEPCPTAQESARRYYDGPLS